MAPIRPSGGRGTTVIETGDRAPQDPDVHAPDFRQLDGRSRKLDLLPNRTYTSTLFWKLARCLDPQAPPSRILDLGSTSNANIAFWGDRGFRVTCFDLCAHEAQRITGQEISPLTLAADNVRQCKLPYKQSSFSAVCAWNVFGRLPFVLAQQFARECHRVLHPSGLLYAIFLDGDGRLDSLRQYQVADRNQVEVASRSVPLRLPCDWIDAEISLLLSRFEACEIKPAPCHTREVLSQVGPVTSPRAGPTTR